jgi:hypothetical protein
VCDWTGDGYLDVLIGAGDGKVHLYQTIPAGDLDKDYDIDFMDFALFANYCEHTACGKCGGADLVGGDGNVDVNDLQQFVENWLIGVEQSFILYLISDVRGVSAYLIGLTLFLLTFPYQSDKWFCVRGKHREGFHRFLAVFLARQLVVLDLLLKN